MVHDLFAMFQHFQHLRPSLEKGTVGIKLIFFSQKIANKWKIQKTEKKKKLFSKNESIYIKMVITQ